MRICCIVCYEGLKAVPSPLGEISNGRFFERPLEISDSRKIELGVKTISSSILLLHYLCACGTALIFRTNNISIS